jgi:hypothetical protein
VVPSEAVTSTVVFGRLVSRFFVPIGTWFQLPLLVRLDDQLEAGLALSSSPSSAFNCWKSCAFPS